MNQSAYSVGNAAALSRQYGPYIQADWGYANHWYPGVFSREVEERGVVGITIGGHDIAITRDASGKRGRSPTGVCTVASSSRSSRCASRTRR